VSEVRLHRLTSAYEERGVTLIEVIVASVLSLIVLLMSYQILNATTNTAQAVTYQASNATNARIALDELEANLRYANGFWLESTSITVSNGTISPTPLGSSSSTNVSGPVLVVSNSATTAFGGQPACAEWAVTSAGLTEATDPTGGGTLGTPSLMMAGVSLTTFTVQIPHLLEIDLTENQQSRATANAVAVHDLISPDNLTTSQAATSECS